MKSKVIVGSLLIAFVVMVIGGIILWADPFSNDDKAKDKEINEQAVTAVQSDSNKDDVEKQQLEESRDDIKGSISDKDITSFLDNGLNPFGTETRQEDLSDNHYQEFIHGMSHQKVRAEKKWGFYELHPMRVEWLLEGLEKVELRHEDIYRNILQKWKAGVFNEVDQDHNAIWNLQGGTVGKATGVLSPQEEQAYINSQQ